MRKRSNEIDMLHGPLAGKIFMFALPLAASSVLQQLFNAADLAVVGRFTNAKCMAAVGSNASVIGLLVNLFVGLSVGANVLIANLVGRGERDRMGDAAGPTYPDADGGTEGCHRPGGHLPAHLFLRHAGHHAVQLRLSHSAQPW